jgi:hypothetical protein
MKLQRYYLSVAAMISACSLYALAQNSDSAVRRQGANPTEEASQPPDGGPGHDDSPRFGPGGFGPGGPGPGGFEDMHKKTSW